MKTTITLLSFIAVFAAACTPTYLVNKTEFQAIPKGSTRVVVSSNVGQDSLFTLITRSFSRDGWVVKSDKGAMQISAEPKSVGGGTTLKPMVYIEGNKAYYSGEWGLDQQGQIMLQSFSRGMTTLSSQPIKFERSGTTKNDVAFQGLVLLAKKVPGEISYEK